MTILQNLNLKSSRQNHHHYCQHHSAKKSLRSASSTTRTEVVGVDVENPIFQSLVDGRVQHDVLREGIRVEQAWGIGIGLVLSTFLFFFCFFSVFFFLILEVILFCFFYPQYYRLFCFFILTAFNITILFHHFIIIIFFSVKRWTVSRSMYGRHISIDSFVLLYCIIWNMYNV